MTRRLVERLSPFAVEQGIALDAAALERLAAFIDLLVAWNRKARLTGDRDPETLVAKHCADSMVAGAGLSRDTRSMDVGSGAGFPGLVAACIRPDLRISLVDSRQKACSFLEAASATIGLPNVRVLNARIEDLPGRPAEAGSYGIVLSRGLRLAPYLPAIRTLLGQRGEILMMLSTGQEVPESELEPLGFRQTAVHAYTLPSGERRRIVRYGAS